MSKLSPAGNQLVQELAQRYGLSTDAVTHMLIAVSNGNGTMAQFGHPEFGGSGQWMSGGMTMVSDLFNNHLKNLVNNLCTEISNSLANHQLIAPSGSFQSQSQSGGHQQNQSSGQLGSQNSLFVPDPEATWWPAELGSPNATGSQNNVKYAYFANRCRLAVKTGGNTWVYDTLNHQIGGFSQQQGVGGSITFSSQFGVVNLSSLPVVWRGMLPYQESIPQPEPPQPINQPPSNQQPGNQQPAASPATGDSASGASVLETLERLGGLMEKGFLSKEEFEAKKADLLSRL
ncbi:SHOCT domain-containing protein [Rubripirellula reticaptiva]|uniref:SHOCT domain-containing protein n=1 Tax=Rubripirellula reticaptiva TaxID=2528013 RepID=UPI0011B56ABE|nr:SHOCT domain-containing protein [Rubripirellula reticaptiva]